MDDLATLPDVTGPTVLGALQERFALGKYYTFSGDILLAINPHHDLRENETEVGQWYRKSKPLQEVPPHVFSIAHRAYRMLLNDVTPQAIVISGRTGSGKSEASRKILTQLLRECRLSPVSGLGPQLIMAQHILTCMITARSPFNAESTRAIKMATLHFRPDGEMASAEFQLLCIDKWYLRERGPGCGAFSIFYAMMAGLSSHELQLYYLIDQYRLLNRKDNSNIFTDRDDQHRHVNMFDYFKNWLHDLGIDEVTVTYAGKQLSAILSVLAAILHVGNLNVIAHPQTGQTVLTNTHELRAVCDLLGMRQDLMEAELLSTFTVVRGEAVRMGCSPEQALWNMDVVVVELYRRLLSVVLTRLNQVLSPDTHYMNQGPVVPIIVAENRAQEPSLPGGVGGLETFLRNMASERVQHHLYDVIFARDVDTCQREKVTPYKIKYGHNTDLISAVFDPDSGIMSKVTSVCLDTQGSPEKLVSLMDADRSLKKNASYVQPGKGGKAPDVFTIKHSGLREVTYSARDFLVKNRNTLPETTRQLMLHSGNPLIPVMANVNSQDTSFGSSPDAFFVTRSFQSDLTYLLQSLDSAHLHHVRCLKSNEFNSPGQFDVQTVTDQLKECCMVETTRQRKYGFLTAIPQQKFVSSYRQLAFNAFTRVIGGPEACKAILQKTQLHGRGVTLSKNSVFLRYMHVTRLHALKALHMRRLITVQAIARGFLARRRFRRLLSQRGIRSRFHQPMGLQQGNGYPDDRRGHLGAEYGNISRQGSRPEYPGNYGSYSNDPPPVYGNLHSPHSPHSSRDYPAYYNGDKQPQPGYTHDYPGYLDDSGSSSVADDPTGLYKNIIDKVLTSMPDLDPSTWAKVIYLEMGKQVAKVYVEEKSVIFDGSQMEFDGLRLGLGFVRNQAREEETAYYRAGIIEGVRLKRDSDGSMSACRLSDQPILVKGAMDLDSGHCCFSEDVLLNRGQLPFEKTIKIFDMKEFHSKISLDLKNKCFSKSKMRRACVVGLSFGRDDADDSHTPCWLCVVNVKALAALDSEETFRKAQAYTAELKTMSPAAGLEKLKANDAKARHERSHWSRVDQREHLQEKEEGGRHVRQKLRAKGLAVGEHVGYSWDQGQGAEKTTMQDLQQWMEPDHWNQRRARGSGQARDWAKVETVVRDEKSKVNPLRSSFGTPAADYY